MAQPIEDLLNRLSEQLQEATRTVRRLGPTPHDMRPIADYLYVMSEHGCLMAGMALDIVEHAAPDHPVRSSEEGCDVQLFLGHAADLFEAAQTLAGHTLRRLEEITGTANAAGHAGRDGDTAKNAGEPRGGGRGATVVMSCSPRPRTR